MSTLTFGIIKPDAVRAGNQGKIIDRILAGGFKIRGMKLIHQTRKQAEGFYAVHAGKGFFDELRTSNYLFQLNILSLIGGYGKEVQRQANYILAQQWYEFAGTDLHNFRHLEMLHDPQLTSLMKKVLDSGNIRNQEI